MVITPLLLPSGSSQRPPRAPGGSEKDAGQRVLLRDAHLPIVLGTGALLRASGAEPPDGDKAAKPGGRQQCKHKSKRKARLLQPAEGTENRHQSPAAIWQGRKFPVHGHFRTCLLLLELAFSASEIFVTFPILCIYTNRGYQEKKVCVCVYL